MNTLKSISSRYAPSRNLSFNSAHVFKTLQLIEKEGNVSRSVLMKELELGEGSIKTLIKHLKTEKMIITTNKGTVMSERGKKIYDEITCYICSETSLPQSTISLGKYNYAVLLRNNKFAIKQGIEQRDMAIIMGATGATTLLYIKGNFLMPGTNFDTLKQEDKIKNILKESLKPQDNDVIIIGSDNNSNTIAELASKAAALYTMENHSDHR